MKRLLSYSLLGAYLLAATPGFATERRQSARAEVRICSQNLNNYRVVGRRKREKPQTQQKRLIQRFVDARCDVVAVQEVGGATYKQGQKNLGALAKALEMATGKTFTAHVGESLDSSLRNGFLVRADIGEVEAVRGYWKRSLPKLQPRGPSRRFTRGPVLLSLAVNGADGAKKRRFLITTMHFKSKAGAWKDPTDTQFETLRMEMAEALRSIVFEEKKKMGGQGIVVVLGDRNSNADSASAAVLSGKRHLHDFFPPMSCVVDQALRALCPGELPRKPRLLGLLQHTGEVLGRRNASYRYKGELYLLDEILIEPDNLWLVRNSKGAFTSGLAGGFGRGSDHKLLWAEFNW